MEAKKRSDRLAEVKTKAVVDDLGYWPTEMQPEELIERQVKVKVEALLNALAYTLQTRRLRSHEKTPGDMEAKTLVDALAYAWRGEC